MLFKFFLLFIILIPLFPASLVIPALFILQIICLVVHFIVSFSPIFPPVVTTTVYLSFFSSARLLFSSCLLTSSRFSFCLFFSSCHAILVHFGTTNFRLFFICRHYFSRCLSLVSHSQSQPGIKWWSKARVWSKHLSFYGVSNNNFPHLNADCNSTGPPNLVGLFLIHTCCYPTKRYGIDRSV